MRSAPIATIELEATTLWVAYIVRVINQTLVCDLVLVRMDLVAPNSRWNLKIKLFGYKRSVVPNTFIRIFSILGGQLVTFWAQWTLKKIQFCYCYLCVSCLFFFRVQAFFRVPRAHPQSILWHARLLIKVTFLNCTLLYRRYDSTFGSKTFILQTTWIFY